MRKLTIAFLLPIAALVVVAAISTLPTGQRDALAQAEGTLYGAAHVGNDGPSTLYTIDTTTGAATSVGVVGFERCSGMDFDAAGILFATCEESGESDTIVLITINPSTGEGSEVGALEIPVVDPQGPFDISFRNSDGTLYALAFDNDESEFVFGTIDTDTGAFALLAILPDRQFNDGNGIAFSPGDVLFRADDGELNTLDQGDGEATLVDGLAFPDPPNCEPEEEFGRGPRINAMDFQPGTAVLFGSLNVGSGQGPRAQCLVTIDTTTGVVTRIGDTVTGLDAIAFAPPAEPTPTPTATPAATATPAPTPTVLAVQQLPTTGGEPTGGASALTWLAAIAGAIALIGSGSAWLAYHRRRVR